MGTSPPAVSLRKLMEEESVMKKQQKQEARSREAAAAKITSAAQARCVNSCFICISSNQLCTLAELWLSVYMCPSVCV